VSKRSRISKSVTSLTKVEPEWTHSASPELKKSSIFDYNFVIRPAGPSIAADIGHKWPVQRHPNALPRLLAAPLLDKTHRESNRIGTPENRRVHSTLPKYPKSGRGCLSVFSRRPFANGYIATLDEVTVTRDGDCARIEYKEGGIAVTNFEIGPEIAQMSDSDIVEAHNNFRIVKLHPNPDPKLFEAVISN
jgi:hypothetical protein